MQNMNSIAFLVWAFSLTIFLLFLAISKSYFFFIRASLCDSEKLNPTFLETLPPARLTFLKPVLMFLIEAFDILMILWGRLAIELPLWSIELISYANSMPATSCILLSRPLGLMGFEPSYLVERRGFVDYSSHMACLFVLVSFYWAPYLLCFFFIIPYLVCLRSKPTKGVYISSLIST